MLFRLKPGLKVRDYRTRDFIPPEGIDVPETDLFFAAMVRDGDAEWVKPEAETKAKGK